jgi:hypothetical protein
MNFFAAVSALVEGRQARVETDIQQKVLGQKISWEKQNLDIAGQQTSQAEEAQRREARQLMGAGRAAIAQSGVGFGGSSADIMKQSATNAELDALNIRYAGTIERMSILNEIGMMEFEKDVVKMRGQQAMRMRWGNAAGALFGGSSSSGMSSTAQGTSNSASGNRRATPTIASLTKGSNTWAATKTGAYGGYGRKGTGGG